MTVNKILTFKSGKFPFSSSYSRTATQALEIEFRLLCNALQELPILPEQARAFEQELTRRSIFSTAAIEGNPLNEDDVAEILSTHSEEELQEEAKQREIKNLQKAYALIADIGPGTAFALSEQFIKDIHRLVADRLPYDACVPGYYRNHSVKVGDRAHGGIATPPKCLKDIQNLMAEYIRWFKADDLSDLPPVIRAALAHYHLALIHPFGDGNGRTARLVEATVLRAAGVKYLPTMLSNYYYREIDRYFIAFSECRKSKEHDLSPFVCFVLQGAVESLHEVRQRITVHLRKAALSAYFQSLRASRRINPRQQELLALLLEAPEDQGMSVNSIRTKLPYRTIYASVSERTARRDLAGLLELRLVTAIGLGLQLNRTILNAL